MPPDAKAAVPALIEALREKDTPVFQSVTQALGRLGPDAKAAVPALMEALKDKSVLISFPAAQALGEIGPDAKEAVPLLLDVMKRPSRTENPAPQALLKIDPETAKKHGIK